MAQPLTASVVIPTYQRCEALRRLLEQLARQTLPPREYEVIVSVDGSEDGTLQMATQLRVPYALRVLRQPHRGRAAACNSGIRAARGELVVLLDDDMLPAPEFLTEHLRAHVADPRIAVLGAVPIEADESAPPVTAYIAAKFNRHLAKLAQPNYVLTLRDFYSGNFSIRRALLFEVGLFDEAFKAYGNEDVELSLRLSRAGIQLKYDARALAHQHYAKTFRALASDTIAKGSTAVLLASKHPEAFGELKLATLHQGSRKWRLARSTLLSLSAICSPTPIWVMKVVALLERWWPRSQYRLYDFTLDYFYWLGARQALRNNHLPGLEARVQV